MGRRALFSILISTMLCLFHQADGVADEFCLEKDQTGAARGSVYHIWDTCQVCACDGALRMFCMPDARCKKEKEDQFNAQHRQPCLRAGNLYTDSSKVQQDCNMCTCNNGTWSCTQNICNTGTSPTAGTIPVNQVQVQKVKTEDREEEKSSSSAAASSNRGPSCEDKDRRCKNWIAKKGQPMCTNNKYVKKNCQASCDRCPTAVEQPQTAACRDTNKNCKAWSKKENLCQNNRQVMAKCPKSCQLCPEDKVKTVSSENEAEESAEPEVCEDNNENCAQWVSKQSDVCSGNRFVRENCQKSCSFCSSPLINNSADEEQTGEEEEVKTSKTAEELAQEQYVAEWKARLIAEGKLKADDVPDGCQFRGDPKVYLWGSQLQGDCGLCTCKRHSSPIRYYFQCTVEACNQQWNA